MRFPLLLALCPILAASLNASAALSLPEGIPANYKLRDWKQTARDFDTFVFDTSLKGQYLPLLWWDTTKTNIDRVGFALPAYVGDLRQTPERMSDYDAITCIGSVLGALSVGIDKSNQDGRDYVSMLSIFYRSGDGSNLYLNGTRAKTGNSFWYEILPSLLFLQIHSHFPENKEQQTQLRGIAEQWRKAITQLTPPGSNTPDFNHTAYNFKTKEAFDNPRWREPDAAAGVAFIQYITHTISKDIRYLSDARLALDFLEQYGVNPYYEILLPYGAYAAARMNAETGSSYDAAKLLDWTLDGSNKRRWGMLNETWGETPVHGLIGSVYPGHEYAFAMNTFLAAGVIAPVARYDDSLAPQIARWLLHVAANARYFYPDAWSPEQQTSWEWSHNYDKKSSIAYEGVRKRALHRARPTHSLGKRSIMEPCDSAGMPKPQKIRPQKNGKIDHIWKFDVPKGIEHSAAVVLQEAPEHDLEVYIASSGKGPWTLLADAKKGSSKRSLWDNFSMDGSVYLRLRSIEELSAPIMVKEAIITTKFEMSPYASGDPLFLGWGRTDLGLYGSAFVGMLGAIIDSTDIEGILLISTAATDTFPQRSLPSFLLHNPYPEEKAPAINVGNSPVDIYDSVSNRHLLKNVSGEVRVSMQSQQTMHLVYCPANADYRSEGNVLHCNGEPIDYSASDAAAK